MLTQRAGNAWHKQAGQLCGGMLVSALASLQGVCRVPVLAPICLQSSSMRFLYSKSRQPVPQAEPAPPEQPAADAAAAEAQAQADAEAAAAEAQGVRFREVQRRLAQEPERQRR